MSDGPPSDREVIQRCQAGEIEPFSLLVERYRDRLYNLTFRILEHPDDALDAAQETFVRAFAALGRFDLDRPFAPWLYRIATNTCLGLLRKRKTDPLSLDPKDEDLDLILSAPGRAGDPQWELERAVRDEQVQAAVQDLPARYRIVILLRYQEAMTYEAIAEALDMPLGTVKTYLHRAHRRLRQALIGETSDAV